MINPSIGYSTLLILFLGVAGRLLPHPPNATPLMTLTLWIATEYPVSLALPFLFVMLLLSDLFLALLHHYPAFGGWTCFTWSGYLAALLGCRVLNRHNTLTTGSPPRWLFTLLSLSLLYWLWTNFGCWQLGPTYPHNATGLFTCYVAALPSLKNSLLGNLFWSGILMLLLQYQPKRLSHEQ